MWKRESLNVRPDKSVYWNRLPEFHWTRWVFQCGAFTLIPNINNKHVLTALLHNGYRDLDFYYDPQYSRSLKRSALVLSLCSPPPTQTCSAVVLSGFVCQDHLILQKICWLLFQGFCTKCLLNVVNLSRKNSCKKRNGEDNHARPITIT